MIYDDTHVPYSPTDIHVTSVCNKYDIFPVHVTNNQRGLRRFSRNGVLGCLLFTQKKTGFSTVVVNGEL